MTKRTRAAIAGILLGLLLAFLAVLLVDELEDREPAVARKGSAISLDEERRVFDARVALSNYCVEAIRDGSSPPGRAERARQLVDELIRSGRAHPRAYIADVGRIRSVLLGAGGDIDHPNCLPDEARRLIAEGERLPR